MNKNSVTHKLENYSTNKVNISQSGWHFKQHIEQLLYCANEGHTWDISSNFTELCITIDLINIWNCNVQNKIYVLVNGEITNLKEKNLRCAIASVGKKNITEK